MNKKKNNFEKCDIFWHEKFKNQNYENYKFLARKFKYLKKNLNMNEKIFFLK